MAMSFKDRLIHFLLQQLDHKPDPAVSSSSRPPRPLTAEDEEVVKSSPSTRPCGSNRCDAAGQRATVRRKGRRLPVQRPAL